MDEQVVWSMFYANLVAMAFHPGALRDKGAPDLDWLAEVADSMLERWRIRYANLRGSD